MNKQGIKGWLKLGALLASLFASEAVLPPKAAQVVDVVAVVLAAADRRLGEQLRNQELPEKK